jgi:peptidoglycan hydrolase-like protein with peptidoglycan-binding domain
MTVRLGSRGAEVRNLQAELRAAGVLSGKVDGVFGKQTLAAVKKFQARHRLAQDGIVGPRTWKSLRTDGKAPASNVSKTPVGTLTTGYVNGRPRKFRVASIGNGKKLRTDAAAQFNKMKAAARRVGINLSPVSGFRTMAEQKRLYALYKAGRGNLAARPGYSNHQGGVSVDISTGGYSSRTYKWLARNARQYGFVNDVRGEPWHWTYKR